MSQITTPPITSQYEEKVSYTTLLENKADSKYTNLDLSFYQYVLDHIPFLRMNSRFKLPQPDIMVRYKYQPEFYLEKECGWLLPVWIFLAVNYLPSALEFTYPNVKNGLYVPSIQYMEDFQEDYMSSSYGCVTYPVGEGLVGPVEWAQTALLSGLHTSS